MAFLPLFLKIGSVVISLKTQLVLVDQVNY